MAVWLSIWLVLTNIAVPTSSSLPPHSQITSPEAHAYTPSTQYDEAVDPARDLAAAIPETKRTHRNILLEVGGEWCVWCHYMDQFFEAHADLLALREQDFVTVKVNYSPKNPNSAFLSQYPKISGYPHLFVLDSSGKFLFSKDTSELEEGRSYNLQRFMDFLAKYSPNQTDAAPK